MSDLAFHALREYQPGDDRRYVHWRSSAKHGRLLVRQFLDTRRSHLAVVVDTDPGYAGGEDDRDRPGRPARRRSPLTTPRDRRRRARHLVGARSCCASSSTSRTPPSSAAAAPRAPPRR